MSGTATAATHGMVHIRTTGTDLVRRLVARLPDHQLRALEALTEAVAQRELIVIDGTARLALEELGEMLRRLTGAVPQGLLARLILIARQGGIHDPDPGALIMSVHRREAAVPTAALAHNLAEWASMADDRSLTDATRGLASELDDWSARPPTTASRALGRRLLAACGALGYRPSSHWPRTTTSEEMDMTEEHPLTAEPMETQPRPPAVPVAVQVGDQQFGSLRDAAEFLEVPPTTLAGRLKRAGAEGIVVNGLEVRRIGEATSASRSTPRSRTQPLLAPTTLQLLATVAEERGVTPDDLVRASLPASEPLQRVLKQVDRAVLAQLSPADWLQLQSMAAVAGAGAA